MLWTKSLSNYVLRGLIYTTLISTSILGASKVSKEKKSLLDLIYSNESALIIEDEVTAMLYYKVRMFLKAVGFKDGCEYLGDDNDKWASKLGPETLDALEHPNEQFPRMIVEWQDVHFFA